MAKKQKFYAVYFIKEQRKEVFADWNECQKNQKGHDNMFKSFPTESEAVQWLESINKESIEKHESTMKKVKAGEIKQKHIYTIYLDSKTDKKFHAKMAKMGYRPQDLIQKMIEEWCE